MLKTPCLQAGSNILKKAPSQEDWRELGEKSPLLRENIL